MKVEGKYSLSRSENYDAYLAEIGVSYFYRCLAPSVKPIFTITEEGGVWKFDVKSSIKTTIINFKLGEPFDEETPDGRMCNSTFFQESEDTLRQKQICQGREYETIFKFDDKEMVATLKSGDVTAIRVYERIPED
ncbi:unnamed protein product [Allacma fusca]|uniref:Cytosolic fatty-acid binding proteins domain-containing protein n=1 Tax=Allacma fusca TaxID=39272 RepID=A0A8J2KTW0_9HEXA|nr:unnamed protein product [Allacma fusca]